MSYSFSKYFKQSSAERIKLHKGTNPLVFLVSDPEKVNIKAVEKFLRKGYSPDKGVNGFSSPRNIVTYGYLKYDELSEATLVLLQQQLIAVFNRAAEYTNREKTAKGQTIAVKI